MSGGTPSDAGHGDPRSVERAAGDANKLLRLLTVQLVGLFRNPNLPRELKLLLIPLLFMVPLYGLTILILLSDLTYCLVRSQEMKFYYYLIFLGVTALGIFGLLLAYALLSDRFVSTQDLESQLEAVTVKRNSRRRQAGERR